jgi:GDP-4-dehydro-6-deoxy-D-mannose reductase
MKALLTGAGGFCGRHLKPFLERKNVEVHVITNKLIKKLRHHYVSDVTNAEEISKVINLVRPDYLFHLAGISHSPDPAIFYRVNVEYAAGLLQALRRVGLNKCSVLFIGTSAEYGLVSHEQLPIREDLRPQPYNHYGISKLAQTFEGLAASREGYSVVIARPFNIIGPGMPTHLVLQNFALQIAKIIKGEIPPVIKVGNLKSSRDFIAIDDVVKIYWRLIQSRSAYGKIVNVCTGKYTIIGDLLAKLIKLSDVNIEVKIEPSLVKKVDVPIHYGSVEKLEQILGLVPSSNVDTALVRILEDVKKEK